MTLRGLAKQCYEDIVKKGFWVKGVLNKDIIGLANDVVFISNKIEKARKPKGGAEQLKFVIPKLNSIIPIDDEIKSKEWITQKLVLIVTEVGEALCAKGGTELKEEIADIFIRLFDLCGYLNMQLDQEVKKKMKYNLTRPHLHNKIA